MWTSKVTALEKSLADDPDVAPDELVHVRSGLWVLRVARAIAFFGVSLTTAYTASAALSPQGLLGILGILAVSAGAGVALSHPFSLLQRQRLERALRDATARRNVELGGLGVGALPIAVSASMAPASGPFDALAEKLEQESAPLDHESARVQPRGSEDVLAPLAAQVDQAKGNRE